MPVLTKQKNSHSSNTKGSPSPHKKAKRLRNRFKRLRMNTVYFKSDDKRRQFSIPSSLVEFVKANKKEFQIFNLSKEDLGYSFNKTISELIDFNVLQKQSKLQNKIDYYITPYNPDINVKESMQFGDKAKN